MGVLISDIHDARSNCYNKFKFKLEQAASQKDFVFIFIFYTLHYFTLNNFDNNLKLSECLRCNFFKHIVDLRLELQPALKLSSVSYIMG